MDGHEGSAPSTPVWPAIHSSEPNVKSPPSHEAMEGILHTDPTGRWLIAKDGRPACVSQHLCPEKWPANRSRLDWPGSPPSLRAMVDNLRPRLARRRLESRAGIAPLCGIPHNAAYADLKIMRTWFCVPLISLGGYPADVHIIIRAFPRKPTADRWA